MSIEALRWALEIGQERALEPAQRHVLMILGNRADERGYCYPSINWICTRTGYGRRTVQTHMKALEEAGLLRRDPRPDGAGGRTSDAIWLGLHQPGLPLPDPRANFALGGAADDTTPAQPSRPPRAESAPNTQDHKKEEKKKPSGEGEPSPIAQAGRKYRENIKRAYGGDYPGSASLNGRLKDIIAKVGAEPALQVIDYYFRAPVPFYKTVKHSIEVLQRDCTKLWIELQAQSGGAAERVTDLKVEFVKADGQVSKTFTEPVTEAPYQCARRMRSSYARLIDGHKIKTIRVVAGRQVHPYSVEEIDADTRARA